MSIFHKILKKFRKSSAPKSAEPVGVVTHFYGDLSVAIVKFNKKIDAGSRLNFKGATTDFTETVKSMQFDHKPVEFAPQGKEIGIKVKKKVRDGDSVYLVE